MAHPQCLACGVAFPNPNPIPFPASPDQDFCGSCGSSDPESLWPLIRQKWLCSAVRVIN